MSEPMSDIADVMLEAVQRNFEEEGRPRKWTPLAKSTAKQKVGGKERGEHPILRLSGDLFDSIDARSGRTTATVSTNREYAPIHHFGGKAGRNKKVEIPPRPFMILTDDDEEEIVDVIKRDLKDL